MLAQMGLKARPRERILESSANVMEQLRGEAGERQVPGKPRVGFAQLYGAPGTAGATIVKL